MSYFERFVFFLFRLWRYIKYPASAAMISTAAIATPVTIAVSGWLGLFLSLIICSYLLQAASRSAAVHSLSPYVPWQIACCASAVVRPELNPEFDSIASL